jgi:inosine-uridine nucleoside N-ribohydrolase
MDCDPGVDDMVALLLASASRELSLLGVTTVAGNVGADQATANALSVLSLAGQDHVPVARGACRALVKAATGAADGVHGGDGLGGAVFPKPRSERDRRHAIDFMAEAIVTCGSPVTLLATGPLTNVALLFARYPEVAQRLGQLVLMGGAIGPGNVNGVAEFNIWHDPEAAYRVLTDSGLEGSFPITMVGLDVASQVSLGQEELKRLRSFGHAGSLAADALGGLYLRRFEQLYGRSVVPIYDALTVVSLLSPASIAYKAATVTVDTTFGPSRGKTSITFIDEDPHSSHFKVGVSVRSAEAASKIMELLAQLP